MSYRNEMKKSLSSRSSVNSLWRQKEIESGVPARDIDTYQLPCKLRAGPQSCLWWEALYMQLKGPREECLEGCTMHLGMGSQGHGGEDWITIVKDVPARVLGYGE